jgi:choline dehydrogenase-like flavoprotein
LYTDRHALLFSREGLNIIRPLMAGGATSMYCGCAAPPPDWLRTRYGLDLTQQVAQVVEELCLAPLPTPLRGPASTRLAEAAGSLGYAWEPMHKFMRPARAHPFDCGAHCMLGCRCGAKWNAAEWIDEAVSAGAEFVTEARVTHVLVDGNAARGVRGRRRGGAFEIEAPRVVLAAGGIGSPLLLRTAGADLAPAGDKIGMDTTVIVYGTASIPGNAHEPPMTYAWENPEDGYLLSTLIDPWLMYPIITSLAGWRYPLTWPRWGRTLGVLIKLKDDLSGYVASERDISKPMTSGDTARLERATTLVRRILVAAGVAPDTLFVTPARGTHPCATVRVGHLLDTNLQTVVSNLYVCDASAFPETLARPTVLTILGLGLRLAEHLLRQA